MIIPTRLGRIKEVKYTMLSRTVVCVSILQHWLSLEESLIKMMISRKQLTIKDGR